MNFLNKIFGKKSNPSEENVKNHDRGKYMPEIKIPADEQFTINFKNNGGKFLYCENKAEVYESFESILKENNWIQSKVLTISETIKALFKDFNLNYSKNSEDSEYFLTTCEYLISNDGSILISSNQIAEKKLDELPHNFIVYATTSQFVEHISEGLNGINRAKHKNAIPTNIRTIKYFKDTKDQNFLDYGSSSKNLYLILLEDL